MTTRLLRYLALGDSYTIGEGVSGDERWPTLLASRLREEGIQLADPEIVAVTGWTTDELSAGIDKANPQGPYDFVTLLIGVNNQYRERGVDEYRIEFRELLSRAVKFAGYVASRVLVVSIPDWSVTPLADGRDRGQIRSEIEWFNQVNCEEARNAGAGHAEITHVSQTQGSLVVHDGLHPNGEAYAAWVDVLLPIARAQLKNSRSRT